MAAYYEWTLIRNPYDSYPLEYPERLDTLIGELSQIGITRAQVLHILDFQETAPHINQKWLDMSEYLIYILQKLVALDKHYYPDEETSQERNPYRILTAPVKEWLKWWTKWLQRENDPELQQYQSRKDIIIWGNMDHISAACNVILSAWSWDFS